MPTRCITTRGLLIPLKKRPRICRVSMRSAFLRPGFLSTTRRKSPRCSWRFRRKISKKRSVQFISMPRVRSEKISHWWLPTTEMWPPWPVRWVCRKTGCWGLLWEPAKPADMWTSKAKLRVGWMNSLFHRSIFPSMQWLTNGREIRAAA